VLLESKGGVAGEPFHVSISLLLPLVKTTSGAVSNPTNDTWTFDDNGERQAGKLIVSPQQTDALGGWFLLQSFPRTQESRPSPG
jgi:hypothetical protein